MTGLPFIDISPATFWFPMVWAIAAIAVIVLGVLARHGVLARLEDWRNERRRERQWRGIERQTKAHLRYLNEHTTDSWRAR